MEEKTFTVSEINAYIGKKLKMDYNLKNIYVKGEISNYKSYPRSHSYFTLKDENSQIPAVMFKSNKDRFLKFEPEDGMKVIVKGKIEVFNRDGKYQLYATRITEDGQGDLHIAYQQLKKKLAKEGLFDDAHKKEIPKYPQRIGVITARTGAAVKDIITTIKRRYPICEVLVFSTLVQGSQAAPQIVRQINNAQNYDLDTLIVGRGGGSIEDLWPFNEEIVARCIYDCETPIISAVGHEIDETIADYVADKRAATPTAAAEFAVPELNKVKDNVSQLNRRAIKSIDEKMTLNKTKLDNISRKNIFKNPESIYEIKSMSLDNLIDKLSFSSKNIINANRNKLIRLESSSVFKNPESMYKFKRNDLDNVVNKMNFTATKILNENRNKLFKIENAHVLKNPETIIKPKKDRYMKNFNKLEILNPMETLKRGYAIAKSSDKVISSAKDVEVGDEIDIEFDDGIVNTKVI
jgi:exodeoxyribonuclease VII large subunit